MERLTAPPPLMIVSDLDHTIVDHHDPENDSLHSFNALWEDAYRHDSLLVFSTGRSPKLYKKLRKEKPLLTPDITIMSVGTEITYGKSMVPDDGWVELLNKNWDRNIVTEEASKIPGLTLQSETEQRPHKVSFFVDKDEAEKVIKELSECLENAGLDVKILYSGGKDLDILPQGAGKGHALTYLLEKFKSEGKEPINTLVCGDCGNDAELFSVPGVYGVMVSNAQEELLQRHAADAESNLKIIHATERCSSGILQAIGHFKLGPNLSPRDVFDLSECVTETFRASHEIVMFTEFIERWMRGEIENSELYIGCIEAGCHPYGIFVHPSGVKAPLTQLLDELPNLHGDKKGTNYRAWVDNVMATETSPGKWLVKFDKWISCGEEKLCCNCTVKIRSGCCPEEGFTWVYVEQTWSEESPMKNNSSWLA